MPKGTKTTKATKKSATKTAAPVAEPAQEVVAAPAPEAVAESTLGDAFTELLTQLNTMRTQITTLSGQIRALRTRSEREIKQAQKVGRKRKNANRKPSGFTKPSLISNELATFLGVPTGTQMARTEVTKEINKYIRAQNLQDPKNGRVIIADGKLRKLLKLNKSDELTYFNLQRYMSPHFPKTA